MPSTYSDRLRLELQATGENENTWGTKANTVFELLEEAVSGVVDIACGAGGDITPTTTNGASDEARQMVLQLTGAPAAAFNLVIPNEEKVYIIRNNAGKVATIKTASPTTTLDIGAGITELIYCDGSNSVYSPTAARTKPAFLVNRGGVDQTGILASTWTKIQLNTEVFDISSYFDAVTNYRWTPPSGTYRITGVASWGASNIVDQQDYHISIYKNGGSRFETFTRASGTGTFSSIVSAIDTASGTDYFELFVQGGGSGNKTIDGGTRLTYMCGELI